MLTRLRLLFGISIFWLALSMLSDGINTLVLPSLLMGRTSISQPASIFGLLTFFGLVAGMLVQPFAGEMSDRTRWRWGRRGFVGLGVLLILASLILFGAPLGLLVLVAGYLAVQIALSVAQAGQQGFIPDLVPAKQRGAAAGLKGFMDIGGAMLGFLLLGQFLGEGRSSLALTMIGGLLVVSFLLTVALVREDRPSVRTVPVETSVSMDHGLANPFRLDLRRHRAFAWLVLSRFMFLLGTYAIGRFLLYFVADRLKLDSNAAAAQAGNLLAGLALITVLAALPAGWAADRFGRRVLMVLGAILSAAGALLLIVAGSALQILLFGTLLSIGSAAFAGANWAMTADLAPRSEAGRFFGLANFGTAGAAAAAGLFGPLIDGADRLAPGSGYSTLFITAALAFIGSAFVLRAVNPETSRRLEKQAVPLNIEEREWMG